MRRVIMRSGLGPGKGVPAAHDQVSSVDWTRLRIVPHCHDPTSCCAAPTHAKRRCPRWTRPLTSPTCMPAST